MFDDLELFARFKDRGDVVKASGILENGVGWSASISMILREPKRMAITVWVNYGDIVESRSFNVEYESHFAMKHVKRELSAAYAELCDRIEL